MMSVGARERLSPLDLRAHDFAVELYVTGRHFWLRYARGEHGGAPRPTHEAWAGHCDALMAESPTWSRELWDQPQDFGLAMWVI